VARFSWAARYTPIHPTIRTITKKLPVMKKQNALCQVQSPDGRNPLIRLKVKADSPSAGTINVGIIIIKKWLNSVGPHRQSGLY